MKKLILKSAKVIAVIILLFVVTTTKSIAQSPPDDPTLGTNGSGTIDNGGQAAQVPFDSDMTILFTAIGIVLISRKLKNANLSFLGNASF